MDSEKSKYFTARHHSVNDFDIEVWSNEKSGSKTIILLPGLGVSEKYFRSLANKLSEKYHVMSVNLPGSGGTNKPAYSLNLEELTSVTAQFIRQESIISPIVIGHSMGCQIAARLTSKTNTAIEKLILIAPVVNIEERNVPMQFVRLAQDSIREPLDVNLLVFSSYIRFGLLRFLKTQRYMMKEKIEASLANTMQPVMIIRGERDKIAPRDWISFLSATLANGYSVEILGGCHNVHQTHPQNVADACLYFMKQ